MDLNNKSMVEISVYFPYHKQQTNSPHFYVNIADLKDFKTLTFYVLVMYFSSYDDKKENFLPADF